MGGGLFLQRLLLTDPAAVHTFSHLSASIVLLRKRSAEGLYPAVDPLQSNSKMATRSVVGDRHYALAQEIRQTLAQYAELEDIIAMLGLEQLSPRARKVVARARRLERFLTQRFCTTQKFTGTPGSWSASPSRSTAARGGRLTPEGLRFAAQASGTGRLTQKTPRSSPEENPVAWSAG